METLLTLTRHREGFHTPFLTTRKTVAVYCRCCFQIVTALRTLQTHNLKRSRSDMTNMLPDTVIFATGVGSRSSTAPPTSRLQPLSVMIRTAKRTAATSSRSASTATHAGKALFSYSVKRKPVVYSSLLDCLKTAAWLNCRSWSS